jgi:hypothetical protein
MRLYRGLKEPYRPEKVVPRSGQPFVGTDFTNCPLMALRYANMRRGVVLILDVPTGTLDTHKVTEELWPEMRGARRFMAWGKFDEFITAILPAKELRALIRMKGVAASSDEYKALLLKRKIQERLDETPSRSVGEARGSLASRAACLPDRR